MYAVGTTREKQFAVPNMPYSIDIIVHLHGRRLVYIPKPKCNHYIRINKLDFIFSGMSVYDVWKFTKKSKLIEYLLSEEQ